MKVNIIKSLQVNLGKALPTITLLVYSYLAQVEKADIDDSMQLIKYFFFNFGS